MVPLQPFIFPTFVKALGAVRWMRMRCFLGTVTILATPNATLVGFNNITRSYFRLRVPLWPTAPCLRYVQNDRFVGLLLGGGLDSAVRRFVFEAKYTVVWSSTRRTRDVGAIL